MTNRLHGCSRWHDYDAFKPVRLAHLCLSGRIVSSATKLFRRAYTDGGGDTVRGAVSCTPVAQLAEMTR